MRAADATALALTHRVDALAAALREAGVDPRLSEHLLGSAAAAAMDALALELILSERPAPPVAVRPAEAAPVRLAA